jgi:hypothetical protein
MGQAFDKDGAILGDMFGESKRDVDRPGRFPETSA